MSDFSLTLVLQIKTSKIINDMAKVQQKSEKISAFGGRIMGSVLLITVEENQCDSTHKHQKTSPKAINTIH